MNAAGIKSFTTLAPSFTCLFYAVVFTTHTQRQGNALQQVNIKFSTGDEEIKVMECTKASIIEARTQKGMIIYEKKRVSLISSGS
jgi:hypothetical protein